MSGYIRTTRICPVNQIHPGLHQAIREYFQKHQLGDPDAGALLCCETISQKQESGQLGAFLAPLLDEDRDDTSHLAILLTADWLIWARRGDRSDTTVTGARLKLIKIKAFVSRRTKDMELEFTGFINDTKESVRGNLQLGPDLAAQKFCEEVGQAVLKEKPPAKRTLPKWLGG
jgi:hypothetical protein